MQYDHNNLLCLCEDDYKKCSLHHHHAPRQPTDFGTVPVVAESSAPKNGIPLYASSYGDQMFPPYHPYYMKHPHYGKPHQSKAEFTDVRQMENTLYKLFTDFHMGKMHAFGEGVTFENMIKVREQQENLARLHFELNLQQSHKHPAEADFFNSAGINSIMSKPFSKSNMLRLIQNLHNLCKSIERLQWKNANELDF